jgi:hypothetical protein
VERLVWFEWTRPLPPKKRPKQASSKEFGQAHENQVGHVQRPNLESPKELDDEVAQGSPPSPELADPKLHLDHTVNSKRIEFQ